MEAFGVACVHSSRFVHGDIRRWFAEEASIGPDHAVASILAAAEINEELQLLGAGDRQFELQGRPIGPEVGIRVNLLAIGEDPAIDPSLHPHRLVEADKRFERGVGAVEVVCQHASRMHGEPALEGLAIHLEGLTEQVHVSLPGKASAEERGFLDLAGNQVGKVRHLAATEPDALHLWGRKLQLLSPRGLDFPDRGIEIFPFTGDGHAVRENIRRCKLGRLLGLGPGRHDDAFHHRDRQGSRLILISKRELGFVRTFKDSSDRDNLGILRSGQEQVVGRSRLESLGERFGHLFALGLGEVNADDSRERDLELVLPGGRELQRLLGYLFELSEELLIVGEKDPGIEKSGRRGLAVKGELGIGVFVGFGLRVSVLPVGEGDVDREVFLEAVAIGWFEENVGPGLGARARRTTSGQSCESVVSSRQAAGPLSVWQLTITCLISAAWRLAREMRRSRMPLGFASTLGYFTTSAVPGGGASTSSAAGFLGSAFGSGFLAVSSGFLALRPTPVKSRFTCPITRPLMAGAGRSNLMLSTSSSGDLGLRYLRLGLLGDEDIGGELEELRIRAWKQVVGEGRKPAAERRRGPEQRGSRGRRRSWGDGNGGRGRDHNLVRQAVRARRRTYHQQEPP